MEVHESLFEHEENEAKDLDAKVIVEESVSCSSPENDEEEDQEQDDDTFENVDQIDDQEKSELWTQVADAIIQFFARKGYQSKYDQNEEDNISKEGSEQRINIILIILAIILSSAIIALVYTCQPRKTKSNAVRFVPKAADRGFPLSAIGLLTVDRSIYSISENYQFKMLQLPKPGRTQDDDVGGYLYRSDNSIFPVVLSNDEIWLVYGSNNMPIVKYNIQTRSHRKLAKSSQLVYPEHGYGSLGVRVGNYFWIMGGEKGQGLNFGTQIHANRITSILSLKKGRWFRGPNLPFTLRYDHSKMCALPLNSTTVYIFYIENVKVIESYNFQSGKWTNHMNQSYIYSMYKSCAMIFDKNTQDKYALILVLTNILYSPIIKLLQYDFKSNKLDEKGLGPECRHIDSQLLAHHGQLHKMDLWKNDKFFEIKLFSIDNNGQCQEKTTFNSTLVYGNNEDAAKFNIKTFEFLHRKPI